MNKSDVFISLIKEVIKNEVKQQVQEEVKRLVRQTALNPYIGDAIEPKTKNTNPILKNKFSTKESVSKVSTPKRTLSKDPMLNEILNSTTPFTAEQRRESNPIGAMMGGSVLDAIQRTDEEDWGEMNLSTKNMNYQPTPEVTAQSSGNDAVDIVAKALSRDYTELVKRFK
jgi:hypothetical protein